MKRILSWQDKNGCFCLTEEVDDDSGDESGQKTERRSNVQRKKLIESRIKRFDFVSEVDKCSLHLTSLSIAAIVINIRNALLAQPNQCTINAMQNQA
jgi:hypothetical protein